jgi:ribosome-associated translation inhibitor RaiA
VRLKCFGLDIEFSPSVLEHAQDRAWAVARRFARRVASITVRLMEGADHVAKCCRIEVALGPGGAVVVEETDADPIVAIDKAAARLKEVLLAKLCQRKPWKRQRVRKAAYRHPIA